MADGSPFLDGLFCGFSYLQTNGTPVTFSKTLNLGTGFTATYNSATNAIDINSNSGSSGVKVRLAMLAGGASSTATVRGSSSILTTKYVQVSSVYTGASSVTLYVLAGLATGGPTTWTIELYDETNAASVATGTSTATVGTPVEFTLSCTAAMLTAPNALYSLNAYSLSGDSVSVTQAEFRIT
jgi:hypothetical protein